MSENSAGGVLELGPGTFPISPIRRLGRGGLCETRIRVAIGDSRKV